MTSAAAVRPLVDLAWSVEDRSARLARNAALVVGGSALLALAARVQIPFVPVPMTLQDFAVLLLAMAFGWRLGGATVLCYLAEGALGLPVFARGGGLGYFAGPTAGYLAGFLLAAVVVGWLAERGFDRRPATSAAAMGLGIALVLVCGASWLARFVGVDAALSTGLVAFLPAAAVKVGLATALLPSARRFLGERAS